MVDFQSKAWGQTVHIQDYDIIWLLDCYLHWGKDVILG